MARCRKEHKFSDWKPMKPIFDEQGIRYIELTEEQIKIEQEKFDKEKDSKRTFHFVKIHWERKCDKCGKEDTQWLDPYDVPKSKHIKVKKTSGVKKIHTKRHGRKMSGYKDEKISKGAQPW